MSGLVVPHDLCADHAPQVKPGHRGPWPCTGELELRDGPGSEPWGLAECTCPCHTGDHVHELPRLSDRTAVHPTDVLGGPR